MRYFYVTYTGESGNKTSFGDLVIALEKIEIKSIKEAAANLTGMKQSEVAINLTELTEEEFDFNIGEFREKTE